MEIVATIDETGLALVKVTGLPSVDDQMFIGVGQILEASQPKLAQQLEGQTYRVVRWLGDYPALGRSTSLPHYQIKRVSAD